MNIKRTWNRRSLKAGQTELMDEARARSIIACTALSFHQKGECENATCFYCPDPAMRRLMAGVKLEQFFCTFELIAA